MAPATSLAEAVPGIIFSHEVDAIRRLGTPPPTSKAEHCIRAPQLWRAIFLRCFQNWPPKAKPKFIRAAVTPLRAQYTSPLATGVRPRVAASAASRLRPATAHMLTPIQHKRDTEMAASPAELTTLSGVVG